MNLNFDEIEFVQIRPFLHSYNVPGFHDLLVPYSKELDIVFKSGDNNREEHSINNTMLRGNDTAKLVEKVNLYIVDKFYDAGRKFNETQEMGVYRQTDKYFRSNMHIHQQATLVSTTYINPPKVGEGGEFQIHIPPYDPESFVVKKDFIYFIPGWLAHTPTPQSTSIPRYCINWVYQSKKRAFNKISGDIW